MIDEEAVGLFINLILTGLLTYFFGRILLRHVRLTFGSHLPISRMIGSHCLGLVCIAGKARKIEGGEELIAPMSNAPAR